MSECLLATFAARTRLVRTSLATRSHPAGHTFTSRRPRVQAPLATRLCLVCHAFTPFLHAFTVRLARVLVPAQTRVKRGVNACKTQTHYILYLIRTVVYHTYSSRCI